MAAGKRSDNTYRGRRDVANFDDIRFHVDDAAIAADIRRGAEETATDTDSSGRQHFIVHHGFESFYEK